MTYVAGAQQKESEIIHALKHCGNLRLLDETKTIHRDLMRINDKSTSAKIWNTLIATYSKCGDYKNAWRVYSNIESHDVYSYLNALILCGYSQSLNKGKKVHEDIENDENKEEIVNNMKIQSALINMYGKNGDVYNAEIIWNRIENKQNRNIVMYGSMMNAYTQNADKREHNTAALKLYDEIIKSKQLKPDILSHLLALKACGNLKEFARGNKIYQTNKRLFADNIKLRAALIIFCVKCDRYINDFNIDIDSFMEAILTVNKNQKTKSKDVVIYKLIKQFKLMFADLFGEREWLLIIDAYGLVQDTQQMLKEYKDMLHCCPFKLNSHILSCLLEHLIKHFEPQHVGDIWKDVQRLNICFNSLVLQSFIICIHRSRYYHDDNLLLDIWNLIVNEQNVKPNLHCYCLAVLAFSKYTDAQNQNMARRLLLELESNKSMLSMLGTNPLSFMHILTSYGNINQLEKMWSFYLKNMQKLKNNYKREWIMALNVLCSKQADKNRLNDILKILEQNFNLRKDLSVEQLISFHRVCIKSENKRMRDKIWQILEQHEDKIKMNIYSHFELNGQSHSISTGYDIGGCQFESHDKVNALIRDIKYDIDTSICPELPSDFAGQKHLKSHSEKKALAVLLHAKETNDIKIKVDMKMCSDCHQFFAQASRVYKQFTIQCADPKGVHCFVNGICKLCQ